FSSVAYSPYTSAIYFGGNNGLYKITPDNISIREVTSDNEQIYATQLELFDHRIFAITATNTLLVIDSNDHVTTVKDSKGLHLYRMCPVNDELIVMTDRGIKKYNSRSGSLISTGILRGIKSEEIRDIKPLGDLLMVATNRGIITTPAKENTIAAAPIFNITSISINSREYIPQKRHDLGYDENNIEIRYSIIYYRNPDAHSLYYKINDGKWTHNSKASGALKLASLSPGNYKIAFYIGELSGETSIIPTDTITLNIQPPFWNTAWFLTMVVFLVVSLAYTYYRWQTGLLKKQNQLLTDKVELERNLHKSVLTSIRSQMNPHFFYNALNTIQAFIIADDKRNASTYLSKFSKLTRTILEMTEKETITLAEEINALRLYLDLEKVRFNNEFQYSINTEQGIDPEITRIPSMIVQPYIENSIKHGLLHKNGEKTLQVYFCKNKGNLSIIIDDNGIGRKKSMELNKIRTDKHKSFATKATMKRIEILNKENKNIGVVYTDKSDEFDRPAGTTVSITIPLIKE
ncbi:MAG: histidine kinase, partial [Chitinophagaceae bacterium]|nr:histidine kinase [Chitinophagaceae bacterium]